MSTLLPDATVLRRLARLRLDWRAGAGGGAGGHRGPRPGTSRELVGVRAYTDGDDVRELDWATTLRSGRPHVRQYRQAVDASLLLLVDASASMTTGVPAKLDYARALAQALAHVALEHHDRAGAVVFADSIRASVAVGRAPGQWRALQRTLDDAEPGGQADLDEVVRSLPRLGALRGMAVVLSDFWPPERFARGIARLARARLSLVALHVVHADELDPAIDGEVELVDLETGETRTGWIGSAERAAYRGALDAARARVAAMCRDAGARYVEISTAVPVVSCVLETLVRGGVLARTRD